MDIPLLHMNEGVGDHSYHSNSLLQKGVIKKTRHIMEESIAELCSKTSSKCLTIAELGCSSGPTALLPLEIMIETIDKTCQTLNEKPPLLQVFLNDLPRTDFNTIFRSLLPKFHGKLKKEKGDMFSPCFVSAMPGSFYGRLFPSNSLHFVHSSYSLHWLSQVPEGVADATGIPLNKGNFWLSETSPPCVHKAYNDQFKKDFTNFLKARSEEIISGGCMVITFIVRNDNNSHCKFGGLAFQLISISLQEMAEEGLIEESTLDSCNLPKYYPSIKDVIGLIKNEGSFIIAQLEEFELSWDANIEDGNKDLTFDLLERAKFVAAYMRAIAEPLLATYFGSTVIDDLFHRFSLKVADYLEKEIGSWNNIALSMIKK